MYYMAIVMRSYLWIHVIADLELEDQILQVKYSIPFTQCVIWKLKGDKIFQRGPSISENFVPGGPKISTKLK